MKTVTLFELNNLVREVISSTLSEEYWVEAELSEVHEVRGHCYMELMQKELFSNTPVAKASAKCWKNKWSLLREKFAKMTREGLKPGMKVLLKVYADFHEAYGFAWIVTDINPEFTMGDMAHKRQEIIDTLKREGVFELQKELVLPQFAQRIAVISSENAAGYGDFCHQLADNPQQLKFYTRLFPAVMQGEGVEESVIGALNSINENIEKFDVVVIIRGGGATSDLSGFDTLRLAENVAHGCSSLAHRPPEPHFRTPFRRTSRTDCRRAPPKRVGTSTSGAHERENSDALFVGENASRTAH